MCRTWLSRRIENRWSLLLVGVLVASCLVPGRAFCGVDASALAEAAKVLPLLPSDADDNLSGHGASGGAALAAGGGGAAAAVFSYGVSGQVRTPGNAPVSGVRLSGFAGNPTTRSDGTYSTQVASGWSGLVTPVKAGWSFTPVVRFYYKVRKTQVAQDYIAEGVGYGIFRVNVQQTANPEDGASWATAFNTIQEGVDAAFNAGGGSVWVAAGTYVSATDPVVTSREFVSVYGGFAGTESTLEARDPAVNVTIIDGENARRCVLGSDSAAIDGFTITRGYAGNGGGVYNDGDSFTVRNCIFTYNNAGVVSSSAPLPIVGGTALGGGGGGAAGGGGGGLASSVAGYTTGKGGAMYNRQAEPVISDCLFTLNSAVAGGAMYNEGRSPTVDNCTFMDNVALSSEASASLSLLSGSLSGAGGGGVAGGGGGGTAAKTMAYATGVGGAMCNSGADPLVTACVFSQNSAAEGGAGMYNRDAAPQVTNCIFTANVAAITASTGNTVLADSLTLLAGRGGGGGGGGGGGVAAGTAGGGSAGVVLSYTSGGAIRNDASAPSLMNCTFSGNRALDGAAVYNEASTPSIVNSILWGDWPDEISGDIGSVSTVAYSDVEGGYPGTSNIDASPLFADPLYDLTLLIGSPCIDTGTPDNAPSVDILGVSRPQGNGFDRGAYER